MADRPLRTAILARSVHPLHGVGGLERHVFDLVRHLVTRDVRVTLITKPPTADRLAADFARLSAPEWQARAADAFGVPPEWFHMVTVPYVTFPGANRPGTTIADRSTAYPLFGWRVGREAVKLSRRGEVDIVHALGAAGLGYGLARRRHEPTVPFVFNPQGLEEFGASDPLRPGRARLKRAAYVPLQAAVRACARGADAVLATDRALLPVVLQHLPVDPAKVEIIPNAIDLAQIDRWRRPEAGLALRAEHGIDAATPLLLSVGRLEENKGFHVLMRALSDLRQQETTAQQAGAAAGTASGSAAAPAWRWVLIGDGPFRPTLERLAAEEGLASRMIMRGRATDEELHGWYEAATLFVHPTLYEGSSLVTLEAMAHATPVVATRAGGLPDKVVPGTNGWLVDPGRADQLTDALREALTARTMLPQLGLASRALVEREFAWPVIVGRLIDLYRRLAAAG
jgi:glycosyltransferase involved in cell wall biosynthesis